MSVLPTTNLSVNSILSTIDYENSGFTGVNWYGLNRFYNEESNAYLRKAQIYNTDDVYLGRFRGYDHDKPNPGFEVSSDTISVPHGGGTYHYNYNVIDDSYTVSKSSSVIISSITGVSRVIPSNNHTYYHTSGYLTGGDGSAETLYGRMDVVISSNSSGSRSANITINHADKGYPNVISRLTFNQDSYPFIVSHSSIAFGYLSDYETVTVFANSGTVSVTTSDRWITSIGGMSGQNGSYQISVQSNGSNSPRNGSVTFTNIVGGLPLYTHTITIAQEGYPL